MRPYRFVWPLVVVFALLASACSKQAGVDDIAKPVVMATVNGEPITQADVDSMLERMLDNQAMAQVDEALRKKVLDSLVASRAMKLQVQAIMSPDELAQVALAVKSYEEELYVKEYLGKHVTPEPVTLEMVQAYYDSHSEEFGAETIKDFQLLALRDAKDEKKRDQLLAAVAVIKSTADWRAKSKELQQKYSLQFQEGRNKSGLLEQQLDQAINSLEKDATSDLIYLEDEIYLARVTNIIQSAPKPLAEVSADIRKKLAAQQLRAAVKKASEDVLKKVEVKILEPNM
jgi:hypothetical protein